MMKKSGKIIIAVLAIFGVIAIAIGLSQKNTAVPGNESEKKQTESVVDQTNDVHAKEESKTGESKKETSKEDETKKGETKANEAGPDEGAASKGGASVNVHTDNSVNTEIVVPDQNTSAPEVVSPEDQPITLPYAIADSNLVIERIKGYNGSYIEDGSNENVSGINAAMFTNNSNKNLEYSLVTLEQNGELLQFKITDLPSGASVIVQEQNRKAFQEGEYKNVKAETAFLDQFEMSEGQIKLENNLDGSIKVTNISSADIPCVRLFYKYYMDDKAVYIGGITYVAKVVDLKAGESKDIRPSHYDPNSCKIMMVRTYSTAD